VVVAKGAQRCRVKIKTSPLERRELEPPRDHHPQHIAVSKQKHVSSATAHAIDGVIGSRSDIGCGFAIRAAILEQLPHRA